MLFINLLLISLSRGGHSPFAGLPFRDIHICNKFYAKIVDENLTRFLSKNCEISDMTKLPTCHVSNCKNYVERCYEKWQWPYSIERT